MNYLSFKKFLNTHKLKDAPTSNVKIYNTLKNIYLECTTKMRDDPINSNCAIVNLHPTKGTHWVSLITNFILTPTDVHHLNVSDTT